MEGNGNDMGNGIDCGIKASTRLLKCCMLMVVKEQPVVCEDYWLKVIFRHHVLSCLARFYAKRFAFSDNDHAPLSLLDFLSLTPHPHEEKTHDLSLSVHGSEELIDE